MWNNSLNLVEKCCCWTSTVSKFLGREILNRFRRIFHRKEPQYHDSHSIRRLYRHKVRVKPIEKRGNWIHNFCIAFTYKIKRKDAIQSDALNYPQFIRGSIKILDCSSGSILLLIMKHLVSTKYFEAPKCKFSVYTIEARNTFCSGCNIYLYWNTIVAVIT